MRFLQQFNIRGLIRQYRSEGLSMRRRLALYLISALITLMSLIILLLNAFGIMNPIERQIRDFLTGQLSGYARNIEQDYDRIAAYTISFAEQMETEVRDYLSENGLSFEDLENNAEAITELQCMLYDTVYLNMQLAPSSISTHIQQQMYNN